MSGSLIVRVPLSYADGWLSGRCTDAQMLLGDAAGTGRVLFFVSLFGRWQWRVALAQVASYDPATVHTVIFRTNHPSVEAQAMKFGAERVWREETGQWRWWAGPAATQAWLTRCALLRSRHSARAG